MEETLVGPISRQNNKMVIWQFWDNKVKKTWRAIRRQTDGYNYKLCTKTNTVWGFITVMLLLLHYSGASRSAAFFLQHSSSSSGLHRPLASATAAETLLVAGDSWGMLDWKQRGGAAGGVEWSPPTVIAKLFVLPLKGVELNRKGQITTADAFCVLIMDNLVASPKSKGRFSLYSRGNAWFSTTGPRKSLNHPTPTPFFPVYLFHAIFYSQ